MICIANEGNEVSLQLWKVYKTLRDDDAGSEGFVRVIDESGEDYLFPEEYFATIELPEEVQKPFEKAVRQQRRAATAPRASGSIKRAGAASTRAAGRRTSR
ncbi:MAG TPA: hypothetical protein VE974_13030 [Thermoanaerobaculia bacterium]|nr:hypothetical protein [Thermoanaerobaculia bacterium]